MKPFFGKVPVDQGGSWLWADLANLGDEMLPVVSSE